MKRWQKVVAALVALVVVFVVVVISLLKTTVSLPATCAWTMDLAEVRKAAASMPGDKTSEVRVEHVTTIDVPEAVVFTGGAFEKTEMMAYAYQLALGDHTIIVDTAMSATDAKAMGAKYDAEAFGRVARALPTASAIYVTHEHADHLGGLFAQLNDAHVIQNARLTREQIANPAGMKPLVLEPAVAIRLQPVNYDKLLPIAPGVVLIKAPGHTPGSQMVYVQRQDGREMILTGDTAWHVENIDQTKGPPTLIHLMMHNDEVANVCQLAALKNAQTQSPELRIMPGHDGRKMKALLDDGTFVANFR